MIADEERAAIRKKAEEIHNAIVRTDQNLKDIPFRSETETLRIAMTQLTEQLHRMERNLQDLLQMEHTLGSSEVNEENAAKFGKEE